MKIEPVTADVIRISNAPALDPITVVFMDDELGRGSIIVRCFDKCWQSYWGAMGDVNVRTFVRQAGVDYIVNKLSTYPIKKADERYLERVVMAVKEAIAASVNQ